MNLDFKDGGDYMNKNMGRLNLGCVKQSDIKPFSRKCAYLKQVPAAEYSESTRWDEENCQSHLAVSITDEKRRGTVRALERG